MRVGEYLRRKTFDSTFSKKAVQIEPLYICDEYFLKERTLSLYTVYQATTTE